MTRVQLREVERRLTIENLDNDKYQNILLVLFRERERERVE